MQSRCSSSSASFLGEIKVRHSHRDRTWQRLTGHGTAAAKEATLSNLPTWAIGYEGQVKWGRMTLDVQFEFRASGEAVPDDTLLERALSDPDELRLQLKGFEMAPIRRIMRLSMAQSQKPLIKPARELFQVFNRLLDPCGHDGTWNSKFKGLDWVRTADRPPEGMADHARTHSSWEKHFQEQPAQQEPALRMPRHVTEDLVADKRVDMVTASDTGVPTCLDPFVLEAENGAVGICPWMAEVGDVIVILHGAKVPYLLRPVSTCSGPDQGSASERVFHFIGECYVMRAMDGGWLGAQLKEREPETFTLI